MTRSSLVLAFFFALLALTHTSHAFQQAKKQPTRNNEPTDRESGADTVTYTIQHNLSDEWEDRNSVDVTFHSANSHAAHRTPATLKFSDAPLSARALKRLKNAAAGGGSGGLYRIRLYKQGSDASTAVMASVPACALVASDFRESVLLQLDVYGTLTSVNYMLPNYQCDAPAAAVQSIPLKVSIQSRGKVSLGVPAEKPKFHLRAGAQMPGAAGGAEGQPAQPTDPNAPPPEQPKSFLQKYWMYLLPVGLLMVSQMLSGAVQEGTGGGAGGAAGGR